MANRKQTVQVGGENTGEITQVSGGAAEQTIEVGAEAPVAPEVEYSEEDRQRDLSLVEDLKGVFTSFDQENAEGVKETVHPPVTSKTAFESTPGLKTLAERFQHLSEAEILHMASVNSWSSELRLEVLRNNRNESRDIMHPPVAPTQEIVLLDNDSNS